MEEDDEEGEEAGEEVEEETKGGGEPKGFEVEDLSRDPSGQEACEEEQRKWDDQDDVARRALVAREWEVIDQVCGKDTQFDSKIISNSRFDLKALRHDRAQVLERGYGRILSMCVEVWLDVDKEHDQDDPPCG